MKESEYKILNNKAVRLEYDRKEIGVIKRNILRIEKYIINNKNILIKTKVAPTKWSI